MKSMHKLFIRFLVFKIVFVTTLITVVLHLAQTFKA